jgi:hypothetical protein
VNSVILLRKLIIIERSIGTASNDTIRNLVREAEDCVLQMQKEQAESFLRDAWHGAMPKLQLPFEPAEGN